MDSSIIQSIVLGIAQGVGEFLPISSTAHLILIPYLFGWPDPGLSFDVALHLGTLIALVFCFWRDWLLIIRAAFFGGSSDISSTTGLLPVNSQKSGGPAGYNKKLLWFLIIATIPGVLAGYFLESQAETFLRDPLLIAFALAFLGLALYLADKFLQHEKNISELKFSNSLVIGLAQALAIVPGISRAGATITAGLLQGLDRLSAARFSLLLSMPIILGATVFKVPHLFSGGISTPLIIGIAASTLSGWLSIKFLLRYIQQIGYAAFFLYRLLMALAILIITIAQITWLNQ